MADFFIAEDGEYIAFSTTGRGPLLFLVGAPVGMAGFEALAAELRGEFTVVTHDPRGIGLSSGRPASAVGPEELANDLAALIGHITSGKALVFGTSGGAVTGLDCLNRHGRAMEHLVVHEPPLFGLLPDFGETLASADAAFALENEDPSAAMQAFFDLTEVLQFTYEDLPRPRPIQLPPSTSDELAKNRFFLGCMAGPTVHYCPNLSALRGQSLTISAGAASVGQAARKASQALADALELPLVDAPCNHLAPSLAPAVFARWLTAILRGRPGNG